MGCSPCLHPLLPAPRPCLLQLRGACSQTSTRLSRALNPLLWQGLLGVAGVEGFWGPRGQPPLGSCAWCGRRLSGQSGRHPGSFNQVCDSPPKSQGETPGHAPGASALFSPEPLYFALMQLQTLCLAIFPVDQIS